MPIYIVASVYLYHGAITINSGDIYVLHAFSFFLVIDCGTPPVLPHATAYYTKTVMDQSVTYSCSPGYEATSPTVLNCSADGSWRGNIMHCISKEMIYSSSNPTRFHLTSDIYTTKGTGFYCEERQRCLFQPM